MGVGSKVPAQDPGDHQAVPPDCATGGLGRSKPAQTGQGSTSGQVEKVSSDLRNFWKLLVLR